MKKKRCSCGWKGTWKCYWVNSTSRFIRLSMHFNQSLPGVPEQPTGPMYFFFLFVCFMTGVFAWTVHTHVHRRGTVLTCGSMCLWYHMCGSPWFLPLVFFFVCFLWKPQAGTGTHTCFAYFMYMKRVKFQQQIKLNITEVKHVACLASFFFHQITTRVTSCKAGLTSMLCSRIFWLLSDWTLELFSLKLLKFLSRVSSQMAPRDSRPVPRYEDKERQYPTQPRWDHSSFPRCGKLRDNVSPLPPFVSPPLTHTRTHTRGTD